MATLTSAIRPPSPPTGFIGGHILAMRRDPLAFLQAAARDYGDVVFVKVPTFQFYLLSGPSDIERVMVSDHRYFIKGKLVQQQLSFIGNGLLTSEGEFWKRQRRLIQPTFHRARVAAYGQQMVDATTRMLDTWQTGQTRDVHAEMMALTLDIVSQALFSADVKGEAQTVGKAIHATLEFFASRRALLPIPENWPTPRNRRNRQAAATLNQIVYRIIAARKGDRTDRGDLLSMLLAAQDDDGSRMTDQQLRDEVMTLFLAGHETTASALSWALYLVARHPDVAALLKSEAQTVLGNRTPTVDDLPNLRYAEMVISETLRLYPSAWRIGREAVQDCEFGGYRIPAGSVIGIAPYVVQRDPRWFANPDVFDPSRWEDGLARRIPKYAYFPFGGGPRICIGNQFAMMEAVLVLAMVMQRFNLNLVSDQPIKPWPSVTLRPSTGGVMMLVS